MSEEYWKVSSVIGGTAEDGIYQVVDPGTIMAEHREAVEMTEASHDKNVSVKIVKRAIWGEWIR